MNKIEELIEKLCPDGVVLKELKEIAIVRGAGVDKKINTHEKSVKLLNYMDIYRNRHIDKSTPKMVVTASDNKISQCNVLKGDVFITPSSEVLNDIGNSAVAIEDLDGVVYSYHIMRLRLKNKNITTSMFLNYLFKSSYVQNQINKNAKGITRFGLTKTQWEKLIIPIPPLEIQQEIVNILDKFTELEARRKQYEYYRNQLLTPIEVGGKWLMNGNEVEWKTLGEIGEFKYGFTDKAKDIGNVRFVRITDINENGKIREYDFKYLDLTDDNKEFLIYKGDLLMARTGATYEKKCYLTRIILQYLLLF